MHRIARQTNSARLGIARTVVVTGLVCVVVTSSIVWFLWMRPGTRAKNYFNQARALRLAGRNAEAEKLALRALELQPQNAAAGLIAAEAAVAQGEYSRAVKNAQPFLNSKNQQSTSGANVGTADSVAIQTLIADIADHKLNDFTLAESTYRTLLALEPDNEETVVGFAKLLAVAARREEVIPLVLQVLKLNVPTDLVYLLARPSVIISEPARLQKAITQRPEDPVVLTGLAWHAANSQDHARAETLLKKAIEHSESRPHVRRAAQIALGDQFVVQDKFSELISWNRNLPASANLSPEVWRVRGRMAEYFKQPAAAIRCYLESTRLAPESKKVTGRLARLLAEPAPALAQDFQDYWKKTVELETLQERFNGQLDSWDVFSELVNAYREVGRTWEAWGWLMLHQDRFTTDQRLGVLIRGIRRDLPQLQLVQTQPEFNPAFAARLVDYPLPQFKDANNSISTPVVSSDGTDPNVSLSFSRHGEEIGLDFSFVNGSTPQHLMHEFSGGGIGVFDFDVDGYPDLYFSQGQNGAPLVSADPQNVDCLFRNQRGQSFGRVPKSISPGQQKFGQGVTVGDVNADGFPDLYVANIGSNDLYINSGDGTFTKVEAAGGPADMWTTSVAVMDLNADTLPDIYSVNYAGGENIFERICQTSAGDPKMCIHTEFAGQPDQIWLNDGAGGWDDATSTMFPNTPDAYGWGIVAWKEPAAPPHSLTVFVTNDLRANYLFRPQADGYRDDAFASAVAVNEDGKPEGCMGIAAASFDASGIPSLCITNFLRESNTFYRHTESGRFNDATRQVKLQDPSFDMLGFGCQFADLNLDGHPELFVANGHIDDLRSIGKPWKMRPQIFTWNTSLFKEVPDVKSDGYFSEKWIGRAVAKIDWNIDGRCDFAVGHLFAPTFLLTNTTQQTGRFVRLRCIGRESNRDAVGTIVRYNAGGKKFSDQIFAGNGFQASNEKSLTLGCGAAETIELSVEWPSGKIQTFQNVDTKKAYFLREGGQLLVAPQ